MNALGPSDRELLHSVVRRRADSVVAWIDSLLGIVCTDEEYAALCSARDHSAAAAALLKVVCVDAVPTSQQALF